VKKGERKARGLREHGLCSLDKNSVGGREENPDGEGKDRVKVLREKYIGAGISRARENFNLESSEEIPSAEGGETEASKSANRR